MKLTLSFWFVSDACHGRANSSCRTGHTGPLCTLCQDYFFKMVNTCLKCPSMTWSGIQIGVVVVILIIICFIVMRGDKNRKRGTRTHSDVLLAHLKIVIGFYQVTSGVLTAFNYVKWPEQLSQVANYAKFVQLNLVQIASFDCFNPKLKSDIYLDFSLAVLVNFGGIAVILVYYILMRIWYSIREESVAVKGEKQTRVSCIRNVGLLLFLFYPSTCTKIFQLLPGSCRRILVNNNGSIKHDYFKSDYSNKCDTPRHKLYLFYVKLMSFYPVAVPVVMIICLCIIHREFSKRRKKEKKIQKLESMEKKEQVRLKSNIKLANIIGPT